MKLFRVGLALGIAWLALASANANQSIVPQLTSNCPADQAILGVMAGASDVSSPFLAQATLEGGVPASTLASLSYGDSKCFPISSSSVEIATAVFSSVTGVVQKHAIGWGQTPSYELQITGTLPGVSSYQLQLDITPVVSSTSGSSQSAEINQCSASANLARSFPSKYLFYAIVSTNPTSSYQYQNFNGKQSDAAAAYSAFLSITDGSALQSLFGASFVNASSLRILHVPLQVFDSYPSGQDTTLVCGHALRQ